MISTIVLEWNEVVCSKHADGMANSVDPGQTAPEGSSLIWVCTVCSDLFVPILGIFRFSHRYDSISFTFQSVVKQLHVALSLACFFMVVLYFYER